MFFWSFWYHFHANLITTSTAGVCYYPQDMGAMTSLNLAANCLCGINDYGGGVYDTSGAA
jgi:hypothetical protein